MNGSAAPLPIALRLRNVAVSYQRCVGLLRRCPFWALKDVSFELYHGETLGILGRNGAGKSTLLKLLAGIIAPEKGVLESDGSRSSLLSLQVGFVPHLTGRQNAVLSGILLGLTRAQVEARMGTIVEFAELAEFIDEPLHTYSSGMRARLGFSVAFQADPDILLIDEVLGVGDVEFQQKSAQVMKQRIRSNKTVVLVSHNLNVLRELCDRLVWIESGETRGEGEIEAVLSACFGGVTRP